MAATFRNSSGLRIVHRLVEVIHENRSFLSEIDGRIGDGDHGVNIDKGFTLAQERMGDEISMSDGLAVLGRTLLMEIGGSMGPLYGKMFKAMARSTRECDEIDATAVLKMLEEGYQAVRELGDAKVGDKTLVDTLDPAVAALRTAVQRGDELRDALDQMDAAAEAGWRSTEDLVAKVGRSSRLGERSRGVLDAGATSCYLMLRAMAHEMKDLAT